MLRCKLCLLYYIPHGALLQGEGCSTEIEIQQCTVNVESGSPLLFGTFINPPLLMHAQLKFCDPAHWVNATVTMFAIRICT